jgi:hypothetical protein
VTATTAITSAIDAKFATPVVLTLKQAQTATKDYVVLFVSRRFVDKRRGSGEVSTPGGRVIVRHCCTTEANLDVFGSRSTAALEDQILADGVTGPFVFESESDATDDDATLGTTWYVRDSHWIF